MQGERRTVLIALVANFVIAVAKGLGGLLTGSSAMLAETAHSIADTVDQVLLLVSLRLGERQPDEEHPFGYGKERFFWTFLVAVIIFLAGAIFSIGDGVLRLTGHDILGAGNSSRVWIAYVVLAVALASEGSSFARAFKQTRKGAREAGLGLVEFVRVSKEPTTKMVFSEDAVAVAGIVVAFAALALQQVTGSKSWDAGAAVLIGLLLVYVAYAVGRDIRGLLLGEAARPEQREALERALLEPDEVEDVVELLTMYTGPRSLLVAARLDLADGVDSSRVEQLSDELDRRLRDAESDVDQVFLDPTAKNSHRSEARAARPR